MLIRIGKTPIENNFNQNYVTRLDFISIAQKISLGVIILCDLKIYSHSNKIRGLRCNTSFCTDIKMNTIKYLHSLDDILFSTSIDESGSPQCPRVNWNGQLESCTTDIRFALKVLPFNDDSLQRNIKYNTFVLVL